MKKINETGLILLALASASCGGELVAGDLQWPLNVDPSGIPIGNNGAYLLPNEINVLPPENRVERIDEVNEVDNIILDIGQDIAPPPILDELGDRIRELAPFVRGLRNVGNAIRRVFFFSMRTFLGIDVEPFRVRENPAARPDENPLFDHH
ncbi:MAG: hypothetical protein LBF66_02435 [Holosporales bacterium]|jgi:hypothetical protein|nr:hypothetical protein [Holosporales bacterium]